MSEPEVPHAAPDVEGERTGPNLSDDHALLAYRIVQALLEHSRVLSDLVALMAQVIDEETTRALTETPHWRAYMDSRRALERVRPDIESFTEVWSKLGENK